MAREFEQPEDPDDGEEFQDVCVVDMVSQFLKKKNNDQSIQIFYGNKNTETYLQEHVRVERQRCHQIDKVDWGL